MSDHTMTRFSPMQIDSKFSYVLICPECGQEQMIDERIGGECRFRGLGCNFVFPPRPIHENAV